MKIVKSFSSRLEAEIAKSKLDHLNINCYIKAGGDVGGAHPFPFNTTNPTKLLVADKNYKKAKKILDHDHNH